MDYIYIFIRKTMVIWKAGVSLMILVLREARQVYFIYTILLSFLYCNYLNMSCMGLSTIIDQFLIDGRKLNKVHEHELLVIESTDDLP